jgi:hypothetical protein
MSEEENIPQGNSEKQIPNLSADRQDSYVENVNEHFPEDSHAPQPSTLNIQPATIDMETHAHHLHHAPGKKFWHYFYEFLMLFLAVFCGFLAENQREHHVEHLREKEYAKTLLEDLAADTTELLDVIKEDRIVLSCIDSISATIQKGIKNNTVTGSFYYYCNIGTFSPTVVWNNATLTQITQTGSLRYFSNGELVKKLSSYYSNSDFISELNSGDSRYRDENIKLRNRVLKNFLYARYSAYTIAHWLEIPDSLLKTQLLLQSDEPGLLNEFANSFETRKRVLNLLITRDYNDALKTASELIALLKKEYHLE